jgi:hypothetical protein
VDYKQVDANRIKHLEMIQAVVSRLAGNSFAVKGWALTVGAAFIGFAANQRDAEIAYAGLVPVLFFYGLDVYFLQAERLFRVLYEAVRTGDSEVEPFFLGATSDDFRERMLRAGKDVAWHDTSWRPTLLVFYGGLAAATVIAALLVE